ncbi:hemolysin III family protein [soil metagenome]
MSSPTALDEQPSDPPDQPELVDAYGPRPLWRGWLHLGAFLVVLPAGLYLLSVSQSAASRVAVAIYWASLAGLFATSASYHRLARTPKSVLWFRRADHSMIYVLIAGTYTPICLIVLPRVWGIPMLAIIWTAALAGIIMKMVRLGVGEGSAGSWLYIVMGWAAVISLPVLVTHLNGIQLALLAAGGLLYTVGAVVLARHRPDPIPTKFGYHEVWHSMTIAAGGCHFALIATMVL